MTTLMKEVKTVGSIHPPTPPPYQTANRQLSSTQMAGSVKMTMRHRLTSSCSAVWVFPKV